MHTDTTDLQDITIVVTQENATIEVMCDFIRGSDAQGCMVVMVGESENTTVTVNLTRDNECTIKTLPLTTPLSDIFGFDVESDGSIGTIAIPGTISAQSDNPLCHPKRAIQINTPALGKFRDIDLLLNKHSCDSHFAPLYRYSMDNCGNLHCCHSFTAFC